MPINHVVLLSFKPDSSVHDRDAAIKRLLALKDNCLHHSNGKPYIKALTGGVNNSTKGYNKNYTHAFVWQFDNEDDRDYYTKRDPEHTAFTPVLLAVAEDIVVVDYAAGVF